MVNLGAGTLHITGPDGATSLLGNVHESEVTYAEDIPEVISINSLQSLEASFELVTRVSEEIILAITGVTDVIIKCCPNRKVVHLVLYSRKKRTRKKNFHRAIKILEELANEM